MKTFETKVTISEDRKLIVELPQDFSPGEHHILIVVDEKAIQPARGSLLDVAGDLIGSLEGPEDLSTNPKYMEGFGE